MLNMSASASDSNGSSPAEIAKPIGDVLMISGEGTSQKNHYKALEFYGKTYELEDTVLIAHDIQGRKPHVSIIKDIKEQNDGKIMLSVQWFYRPEDVSPRKKGKFETVGARELYFSFHKDDVPAESIIHKCIVHFIAEQDDIPNRKKHPGFIVQRVYNPNSNGLSKLTNNGFLSHMQQEIDLRLEKTMRHLGIHPEDKADEEEDN